MWPNLRNARFVALVIALVLSVTLVSVIAAQDTPVPTETPAELPTAAPTETPAPSPTPTDEPVVISAAVVVLGFQPTEFVRGSGGSLTISGSSFTSSTTVSLNGTIPLAVMSQTAETLTVSVGANIPAGVYTVQVSDPLYGTVVASSSLTIVEPTALPQTIVTQNEPSQITAGQAATLSLLGANFTSGTTVRLVGYGLLTTTFVNSSALTAVLPSNIPAGQYTVEVSDPTYGTTTAPSALRVVAASVAATATPTSTPVPGQPVLVVRSFSAAPASIYPGGATQLTFEVVNVGTRTAQGAVVSLGSTDFAPASGQASITLPDLAANASWTVALSVIAPSDAAEGVATIPLSLSFYDFSGQTYTDQASLSVTILAEAQRESQVVLDSYQVTPGSALPGETVNVQALFVNTGTETASQVLVQLDSAGAVLIAGSEGNSFPIGDMQPGARAAVVMPLVVAQDAGSGVQAQSFTITYLQNGDSRQATASISLGIDKAVEKSPMLLLASYDTGQDEALQPGQQFTYLLAIQNAGAVDVSDLLVTFGGEKSSSSSSTTSSSLNFAPLGSGDTVLMGDLAAGATATLSQEFIVNDGVTSGVYTLSLTLQYTLADGTTAEKSFNTSLIVVVPPRLRITLAEDLDDPLTVGESYTVELEIVNLGSSDVALTGMRVMGDNLTVTEGAETLLDPLQSDDDTAVDITLEPDAVGDYTLTVAVDYLDDLNRTQTVTTTFAGAVEERSRPTMPARPFTPPDETTGDDNVLGRLLLGFLGFGG